MNGVVLMFGGKKMDTFMEKLAHRLTAQEMIRANTAAEAEEVNHLKEQVRDYHECLAQMENLVKEGTEQIRGLQSSEKAEEKRLQDEINLVYEAVNAGSEKNMEYNARTLEKLQNFLEEKIQTSSDEASRQSNMALEEMKQLLATRMDELKEIDNRDQLVTLQSDMERIFGALGSVSDKSTRQNLQIAEEMKQFIGEKFENNHKTEESIEQLKRFVEVKLQNIQQDKQGFKQLETFMNEKMEESQERIHKECVKVYRNVQAAMVEENEKQHTEYASQLSSVKKKLDGVIIFVAIAAGSAIISLILQVLSILHIL